MARCAHTFCPALRLFVPERKTEASGSAAPVADSYGRVVAAMYEPLLGFLLAPMRKTIAAMLRESGCRSVLDLCCGPGGLGCFLRQAGFWGVGLDHDPNMLAQAVKNNPHNAFIRGDAGVLPFASQTFDAAVIALALHEMPLSTAEAALGEALRVSRRVIVAEYRLAERNLDLPGRLAATVVERLVGGEHWRNYKIFMQNGGIEGLLYRGPGAIILRRNALAGAAAVIMIE